MKNVLLLSEAYSGGVKTYIDTIIMNQEQLSDIQLKVLVSSKRKEEGIKINDNYLIEDNLSFDKSPLKLSIALKAIHQVVKKNRIDIIHANSTFSGILMYFYSFFNRELTFIYTPHGYYSFKKMGKFKKFLVRFAEKRINHISDKVIHVSDSEETEAITNNLLSPGKSIVIVNGVKEPTRKATRNVNEKITIVNLARVDDQKNPFEFIEIAKKVVDANDNIQFVWAGNGKYLEAAREKVKTYHLERKIRFVGFSDQKDKILEQSDLYFSTSFYEGLPFSVVEAMSYKLPLILTDIIGHRDLVINEENGILFKHNEYRTVADFIQMLIDNKEKWHSMSKSSYDIFNSKFSVDLMVKNLADVYKAARR